jgi:hypothetical protein
MAPGVSQDLSCRTQSLWYERVGGSDTLAKSPSERPLSYGHQHNTCTATPKKAVSEGHALSWPLTNTHRFRYA